MYIIVCACVCESVCYGREVKVSHCAKKTGKQRERNRTFPRQRESRTLVSSEGPPEKPEQRETHTHTHTLLEKHTSQGKQIITVYFNIKISQASAKWVLSTG